MREYYEPDSRWELYQFNSKEEYAKAFIINGYFHDQVPEDILKAYETIEYLMAHAYYHWPMYDEAFSKVLFMIEMGIKLKAKQLNIPIARKKNGKRWERRLSLIINDVCNEDYLSELKQKLDRSAGLRDRKAHPKKNTYSGPSGGTHRNIKYCINVINRLFRSSEWHKRKHELIVNAEEMINKYVNKLLIVKKGREKRVISSILGFDIVGNTMFIVCLPILDVNKLRADGKEGVLPDPVTYTIRNYELDSDEITGKTLQGEKFKLFKTASENLVKTYVKYREYMQSRSDQEKSMYINSMVMQVPWHLSNAEYQYLSANEDHSFT